MKAEIISIPASKTESKYPYLARHESGIVVMFTDKNVGTIVIGSKEEKTCAIGEHSRYWSEEEFKPLPPGEAVQLSN